MRDASAQPRVSIVICAYNAGPLLRAAVDSALAQTWSNLEVLVVDDGSTDGCTDHLAERMGDPRLRLLRQANTGKAGALNLALRELTGAYYALLDADDLCHPERVARQMECFDAHPELAGVFCGFELLIHEHRLAPRFAERSIAQCRADIANFRMPGHDPTAMYRMDAVRGFTYTEELRIGEGLDYILRVGEQLPLMVCGGVLYSYRVNLEGLTKSDPRFRDEQVRRALTLACTRRGVPLEAGPRLLHVPPPTSFTPRDRDNNLAAHFIESVVDLRRAGRWGAALRTALQCARMHPCTPHYLKPLVLSLVPLRLLPWLRRTSEANR
ncbi:MAG: glycosyltransferase family 2 protein [Planctomycetes bacterium]|nr:glycosyltransferase family 2 protein [Planctomycetota bacterium]MCB9869548.1 glycosyltransferase family 2 protein [Planctomycetota bacterium]MCB9889935.1 glycosyltransferase family 2 protein [Planctomycetota bacterium]